MLIDESKHCLKIMTIIEQIVDHINNTLGEDFFVVSSQSDGHEC